MASQAHYGIAPSINLARTLMRTKYDLETTFLHGKLIPLDMIPVIPGSSFKIDLTSYIRMSNPIYPIFGNITVGIHAFFVPMRLLWEHTEEFFGANEASKGPQTTTYYIPQAWFTPSAQTVADYLGYPIMASGQGYKANCLKLRAYMACWNSWYRPEQVSNPFLITLGDGNSNSSNLGSRNGTTVTTAMEPIEVAKKFDVFTACTLSPQYGDPVTIQLGEDAPVILNTDDDQVVGTGVPNFVRMSGLENAGFEATVTEGALQAINGTLEDSEFSDVGGIVTNASAENDATYFSVAAPGDLLAYDPAGTLKVDLSNITAVSIRDLRFAVAMQRYLELLNYGSRYFEILRNVYGVTNPDARLQRPEHIGQIHFPIQIQQVLSTAGAATDKTTKLGQPGANSVTLNRSVLSSKGFTEFGYICIMLDTKHDRVYSQGLRREDFVQDRFDIYAPQFDHVGDFAVQNRELLVKSEILNANAVTNRETFGFQEAWYNERYRESRVSGYLNPNVTGSIPYSLAEAWANLPELNEDFMLEDRDNIARVLTTGDTGPDYLANFHIELRMVKPMSAHSVPGLMDHVGRL